MDVKVEECVGELTEWLEEAKQGMEVSAIKFCTPATLRRYAVARNGDFDAAVKNLQETIEWRKTNVPYGEPMHCVACDADLHSHAFFPIGVDSRKRVVVYACAAKAKTNETAVTVGHMVQTLEHAWLSTEKLGLHHQWLWLVDFSGFGLRHALQGKTSNASLAAFSSHMPERLGNVLLINPPGVFDILLAVIKPFIDARTMAKVHIVRCTPETAASVLAPFGIEPGTGMSTWMTKVLGMEGKPGSIPSVHDDLDQDLLADLYLPYMDGSGKVKDTFKRKQEGRGAGESGSQTGGAAVGAGAGKK